MQVNLNLDIYFGVRKLHNYTLILLGVDFTSAPNDITDSCTQAGTLEA